MNKPDKNRKSILVTFAIAATLTSLISGCSRPEEAPSPSPAPTTVGSAPGAGAVGPMPGGAQGDAAYYSKTYGAGSGAARPR